MCPTCGNKPLSFSKWVRTLNPFRIRCNHCEAKLGANSVPYLWTLFHMPIGLGLWMLGKALSPFESSWGFPSFLVLAAGTLFCTAYVIPYFGFRHMYRVVK